MIRLQWWTQYYEYDQTVILIVLLISQLISIFLDFHFFAGIFPSQNSPDQEKRVIESEGMKILMLLGEFRNTKILRRHWLYFMQYYIMTNSPNINIIHKIFCGSLRIWSCFELQNVFFCFLRDSLVKI